MNNWIWKLGPVVRMVRSEDSLVETVEAYMSSRSDVCEQQLGQSFETNQVVGTFHCPLCYSLRVWINGVYFRWKLGKYHDLQSSNEYFITEYEIDFDLSDFFIILDLRINGRGTQDPLVFLLIFIILDLGDVRGTQDPLVFLLIFIILDLGDGRGTQDPLTCQWQGGTRRLGRSIHQHCTSAFWERSSWKG